MHLERQGDVGESTLSVGTGAGDLLERAVEGSNDFL